jgi:hypothetical protein
MGYPVKPANYQTCVCGKVCKGLSALQTHGRKCEIQQVRSAMNVYCASENLPHFADAALLRNFDKVRAAMVALPREHPASGMVN